MKKIFRKRDSKKAKIEQLQSDIDKLRASLEDHQESNQLKNQIISKLKDFIDGSLTNEEKLTEFNSLLTRITEVLVIDRPGSNDKLLSRVLSLDRRMDRWDQDKNTLKNLNEIVDEVSRKNTELDSVVHRQSEQIENFKTCQICFENYDYKNRHRCIFSTCGHVLCFTCAEHICHNLSKNCPTCRRPVSPNAIIKIFEAT